MSNYYFALFPGAATPQVSGRRTSSQVGNQGGAVPRGVGHGTVDLPMRFVLPDPTARCGVFLRSVPQSTHCLLGAWHPCTCWSLASLRHHGPVPVVMNVTESLLFGMFKHARFRQGRTQSHSRRSNKQFLSPSKPSVEILCHLRSSRDVFPLAVSSCEGQDERSTSVATTALLASEHGARFAIRLCSGPTSAHHCSSNSSSNTNSAGEQSRWRLGLFFVSGSNSHVVRSIQLLKCSRVVRFNKEFCSQDAIPSG